MSEAMIARLEASVEHNEATGNFRCKREIFCPVRQLTHQRHHLFNRTLPDWHFADDFVVDRSNDWITIRLKAQHRVRD